MNQLTLSSQSSSQLTRYVALLQWRMTQSGNYDPLEVDSKLVLKQEKQMSRQSF